MGFLQFSKPFSTQVPDFKGPSIKYNMCCPLLDLAQCFCSGHKVKMTHNEHTSTIANSSICDCKI